VEARMRKVLAATFLAALAMSLSACGSNGDDEAANNISDSIMKAQKSSSGSAQFFDVKRKDADCIGKGLVDKIGTDKLQKYGLLDKDNKVKGNVTSLKMSATDAKAATGVLFGCTDVQTMIKNAITKSGQVPQAMKSCVDKVLTQDNLRSMFTQVFEGDSKAAGKALVQPMTKCALGSQ
jgi:hypothetical protein